MAMGTVGLDRAGGRSSRRRSALGTVVGLVVGLLTLAHPLAQPAPAHAAGPAQFLITPTSFDFGDVPLGSPSPQQTVTITNKGSTSVTMSGAGGAAGVFGGSQNCQGLTLAPGASCQMFYSFTPSALGPVTGSTSGSWNGQPFALTFKGKGVNRFLISPTSFDFGTVALSSTSPSQTVTITNLGSTAAVMSGAGGAAGEFGGSQNCQGTTLAPGASCQMFYAFSPTVAGARTGSTSGSWNGQPFSLTFKGNASPPQFLITPTSFDFGDVPLGSAAKPQTVTVKNTSSASVVMSGAGGAAGAFGGSQNCQGTTLAPGASCQIFYAFTPTALGLASGSTSGSWNGQPFAFTFKGAGIDRFLITPTGFDFGDVPYQTPSPSQTVTVTNRGTVGVVMSGAGGAAGAFGGSQNCQGNTLAAGASCQIFYAFTPSTTGVNTGSTSGSWNGQPFAFTFKGTGLLANAPVPPGAPQSASATTAGTSATVTWTPPISDGGSPLTSYVVTSVADGSTTVVDASTTSQTFTGLAPGSTHSYSVIAVNAQGPGPARASNQVVISPTVTALAAAEYVPVAPERLLDTRVAQIGYVGGKPGAGAVVELQVTGRGVTQVPGDALAVVLNVTGVDAGSAGFATVWPCGGVRPETSNLNLVAGGTAPNLVVSKLGVGGKVCVFTDVPMHVLADVNGYFPVSSSYRSVAPERLLDTRVAQIGYVGGKPGAGAVVELQVTGRGVTQVPGDALAVVLNVTGVDAGSAGFATVWPCGGVRPETSNLNLVAGGTAPNLVVSKLGVGGKVCVFTDVPMHVLADVNGYFPVSSSYRSVAPERLLDTRVAQIGYVGGKPGAGAVVELQVTGRGVTQVPGDALAVVLNVTGVDAGSAGFATVWPCGGVRPETSNLNLVAGGTAPNLVVSKLGVGGKVCVFTDVPMHVLADVNGYFPA